MRKWKYRTISCYLAIDQMKDGPLEEKMGDFINPDNIDPEMVGIDQVEGITK